MVTQKQIFANRANAQRSTGPKSEKGKLRSSMNSWKHGLAAKRVVAEGEDSKEFNELLRDLNEGFSPGPGIERELVFQVGASLWRLSRILVFEATSLGIQHSIVPRDPRLDEMIESRIQAAIQSQQRIAAFLRELRPQFKNTVIADPPNPDSIRADLEAAFAPLPRPEANPAEILDLVLKVTRHESILVNSLSKALKLLLMFLPAELPEAPALAPAGGNNGGKLEKQVDRLKRPSRYITRLAELIVIDNEEPAEFQQLYMSLVGRFCPLQGAEDMLTTLIACCLWRLRRISAFEAPFVITAKSAGAIRDPRIDAWIDEQILMLGINAKLLENSATGPNATSADIEAARNFHPKDAERELRDRYNALLPANLGRSPDENQEALIKIAGYESALRKVLERLIGILGGLQAVRRTPRALSQSSS